MFKNFNAFIRSALEVGIAVFMIAVVIGGIFGQKADANAAYQFYLTGVGTMATPSITLNPESAATIVGTLPAGKNYLDIHATGGPINWGDANVTSSTVHPFIASGESKVFGPIVGRNPLIYLRGIQSGTTPTAYLTAY